MDYVSIAKALGITVESAMDAHKEMLSSIEVQKYLKEYTGYSFLEGNLLIGWILCELHFGERKKED